MAQLQGRISVDQQPVVKELGQPLRSYKLNNVATKYLGHDDGKVVHYHCADNDDGVANHGFDQIATNVHIMHTAIA